MSYLRSFSGRATSQGEPLPGRTDSVKNNAGGFGFAVDKWQRLRRFLILGSEGGTYYVRIWWSRGRIWGRLRWWLS